jgi:hypothetical protein
MGLEKVGDGVVMLPPAPGKCTECAVAHDPRQPHNRDSLFYQYHFANKHGRWPTWGDAVAHCDQAMRKAWKAELVKRGVWKEKRTGKKVGKPGHLFQTTVVKM